MKRQFVKAASTPQMIDAFEAKLAEMQSPVESSTDWATDLHDTIQSLPEEERYFESNADHLQDEMDQAGGYRNYVHNERKRNSLYSSTQVNASDTLQLFDDDGYHNYEDTDGMYTGVPGSFVTLAELKNYWNDFYDDDPVLNEEYDRSQGQKWLKDTLRHMKEVVESTTVIRADDESGQTDNLNIFMLMEYSAGDSETGIDGDEFWCWGKFFAADLADAEAQWNQAKGEYPERLEGTYVNGYNDHFDDGSEVYPNLDALLNQSWIDPNDYDGNMPEEPVFESTEIDQPEELEACGDIPVEGSMGRYDDYFGQTAAKTYGDLICEHLKGQTVSKRQDLAEQPGGLIYEADLLGIDMWDLLEALEGLCYEGRAMEIDESTYKIK